MRAPKTFEEGLQRLQELLAKMQDETTTLDQSVKLYAEHGTGQGKITDRRDRRIAGTARRG